MSTQKTLAVTLYGNLGGNPQRRSTREQQDFRKPGRELYTFSLAVNAKDREDNPLLTRWHPCIDWNGLTATYRKGDRVALTGFFKLRTDQKHGEVKEIRELVVTAARLDPANGSGGTMSRGDYSRKQAAAVLIGRALKTLGWRLYGWKEDRSNARTDFYDPESWHGVAAKNGCIACVNVSPYDAESRSGQPEVKLVPVPGDTCPRCSGSGEDPLGWTLEEARRNPGLYNTDRLRAEHLDAMQRADLPSQSVRLSCGTEIRWLLLTVSRLRFKDNGRMRCAKCSGQGHLWAQPKTEVLFTWPHFEANPRGMTWHVEKGGRVIASGTGLDRCDTGSLRASQAAAQEIAERIDASARDLPERPSRQSPTNAPPRVELEALPA